jgi:SNF2 family DNA or RNA helicase
VDDPRSYALCLEAHRVALFNTVDDLLCLGSLHDVEHLWFQIETARKVIRRFRGRALLCDEVGLGKTIEAGMIIKEYLLRGLVRSVLVLVPPALVHQWREEMKRKFGLDFATTSDPLYKKDSGAFWREARLCIASLPAAKARRNVQAVVSREFDLIVVDEAHHLKNRTTQAWKLVNSMKSRFLVLLTATPLHNSLVELHNLITLLKPGQLKTRAEFLRQFVSNADSKTPVNAERLRDLLSEVMIRNTRALSGVNLPPRHAITVCVDPRDDERRLYDRLSALVRAGFRGNGGGRALDRMTLRLLQSEAGSSPAAVLASLERLAAGRGPDDPFKADILELADLSRALEGSTKVEALESLLTHEPGQTIVFVSFRATLEFVASHLRRRGFDLVTFHGGQSAGEKDEAIAAFRKGVPVLLTTEVGGEGRNLQFCHRMVNFDLPWNPMRLEQRIGRIHRIGQDKETLIWNFCALGSVEDHLLEVLDKKINMFELVIGEVDMILGQMEDQRDFADRVLEAWAAAGSDHDAAANFERLSAELVQAKAGYDRVKNMDTALFGDDYEV